MPRFRPSETCMGASNRRPSTLAARADRHRLYERSVQSTEEDVELIAQISQTDWWQSVLAPHYAWGLFAGTAFLLGALGRQAAMNRGDHRAFTGPTADVFANG